MAPVSSGLTAQNSSCEAHVERYKNSPVMHKSVPDEYKPAIFKDGVRRTHVEHHWAKGLKFGPESLDNTA